MYRLGLWIAKHRIAVLIFAVILLIPAVLGYLMLHVNYDILYYLPDDIETMQGQQILLDDFGKGAYAKSLVDKAKSRMQSAIGKTITEKGFMSTTSSRQVAEDWQGFTGSTKPVVMEIKTGSKTRGVNLSGYDKNVAPGDAQHERLLARGQSYHVDSIGLKNGNIYVNVTME